MKDKPHLRGVLQEGRDQGREVAPDSRIKACV